jgi:thiol-disulfide isomerase/thioredoxin
MAMSRRAKGLLAGLVFLGSGLAATAAPPPVDDVLAFKPYQKGVVLSTPTAAEKAACKVELVQGTAKGSSGWVLKDANGRTLRKFFDNNGDKYPDQWSYYKDGLEVYRELDANFNGSRDTYMWLNTGGMKVGVDRDEKDGVIDYWTSISIEELSQEVVKAVGAKDLKALQALMVTEDDLKAMGTPAGELARIAGLQKQAAAKFQATCAKLSNVNETTKWLHVETGAPSRLPADTTGMKRDVLMYYRAMIVCETGNKADMIQFGEIVQVGDAWKLIDAPLAGDQEAPLPDALSTGGKATTTTDSATQELLKRIAELDKTQPPYNGMSVDAKTASYHLQRADMLEQVIARSTEAEAGQWIRQLADSLSTAVQASPPADAKAYDRLVKLVEKTVKDKAAVEVAAYVAFRELTSDYSRAVAEAKSAAKMLETQTKHMDRLAKFVAAYPKADDGADALLQLGMISEFQGKEPESKKWYEQLVKQYGTTPQAVKANGALRRMSIEGRPWELTAQAVSLNGLPFGPDKLRGKVVVVYYWADWCQSTPADFAKLKQLAQTYRSQGLEVVGISVDDDQAKAEAFLKQHNPVGYQLFAPGGLESPLAQHYGLIIFPNIFLVGRDGKVISRTLEAAGLEDEVKKAIK